MSSSVQYRHPWLYRLTIPLIHTRPVLRAFRRAVGKHVSVFDVAAGFGGMAGHIDRTNTYSGIDLNDVYLAHARQQGLDVRRGNIFDAAAYKSADVFILVDVVHHIAESKLPELFDLVFAHAKRRVVVMEPYYMSLCETYGPAARPIEWALRVLDSDGTNTIGRWFTRAEYESMFTAGFSSRHAADFTVSVQKAYPYYIVTYTRKS
ncbi:MAG TPA: class I SAM-dependent methyltransferase [Candidatus Saccharimonadales bacterium]|nr:class I SAM-dependent methyltransferase [Candidatus Saccharimonadales bacterium]